MVSEALAGALSLLAASSGVVRKFNGVTNRSTDRTGRNIRTDILKQEIDGRSFTWKIQQAHLLDFLNSDSRHRDCKRGFFDQ
jgi:hypothetical protein